MNNKKLISQLSLLLGAVEQDRLFKDSERSRSLNPLYMQQVIFPICLMRMGSSLGKIVQKIKKDPNEVVETIHQLFDDTILMAKILKITLKEAIDVVTITDATTEEYSLEELLDHLIGVKGEVEDFFTERKKPVFADEQVILNHIKTCLVGIIALASRLEITNLMLCTKALDFWLT